MDPLEVLREVVDEYTSHESPQACEQAFAALAAVEQQLTDLRQRLAKVQAQTVIPSDTDDNDEHGA